MTGKVDGTWQYLIGQENRGQENRGKTGDGKTGENRGQTGRSPIFHATIGLRIKRKYDLT